VPDRERRVRIDLRAEDVQHAAEMLDDGDYDAAPDEQQDEAAGERADE
jgi:hypothetical protein